jgi:hypothetical protein
LTQETVTKPEPVEISSSPQLKETERKKQLNIQELIEALKSTADDIGQISELTSEEKILVTQFFASFLKLMKPLTPSISVSQFALPPELSDAVQAHVDPTGHLVIEYPDGHVKLEDLSEEKNRDLMTTVIVDILPKFKTLTAAQKRKLENRMKLLSTVTKEIQKSADALPSSLVQE